MGDRLFAATEQNRTVATIDRLLREGTLTSLRDGQLLDRYLTCRDEAAFEALVNLHGPMVLGLCRRMLRDPRDIEDAFQATFLVLVRKAPTLRDRDLLANWLYGVAYRVAVRARANLLRRKSREVAQGEFEAPMTETSTFPQEYDPGLDQELNRLPVKYRAALVLCYLKGMTHDQAADELRCPVGTIRSRLARGRDLLRKRLVRRGYDPSLAPLATPLPLPASLVRATVEAAAKLTSARAIGAATTSAAVRLAEGVLTTMTVSRIRTIVLSIVAMALTGAGVVAIAWNQARWSQLRAQRSLSPTMPPSQVATSESAKKLLPAPRKIQPGDLLQIEVVEALPGRPISGARIVRPDGTISLGFYGDIQVAGLDRNQIKVEVINHLRRILTDQALGLIEFDPNTYEPAFVADSKGREVIKRIKPIDSDVVFVDDSVASYDLSSSTHGGQLEQVERRLDDLNRRFDSLLAIITGQGHGTEKSAPVAESTSRQDEIPLNAGDLEKKHFKETASQIPPDELNVDQLRIALLKQRLLVEEKQKEASAGRPVSAELNKARSEFEQLKGGIPKLISSARESLERLNSRLGLEQAHESRLDSRRANARVILEEKRKLLENGKIPEEEYLDAASDLEIMNGRVGFQPPDPPTPLDLDVARNELREAEALQAKYLGDSPKEETEKPPDRAPSDRFAPRRRATMPGRTGQRD